jgi:hypothetical protein
VLFRPLTPHRASKKLGLEQAVLGTRNFNEVDLEESEARKVPLLCFCVSKDDAVCCMSLLITDVRSGVREVVPPVVH